MILISSLIETHSFYSEEDCANDIILKVTRTKLFYFEKTGAAR